LPAGSGALAAEPRYYSKDYWDLVLEQLGRRRLFRWSLAVLTLLYGLAILAPFIANDRPYRLVAVDYGVYEQARGELDTLGRALVLELSKPLGGPSTPADWSMAAKGAERALMGLETRFRTLERYAPAEFDQRLGKRREALRSLVTKAAAGQALDAEVLGAIEGELGALAQELLPLRPEASTPAARAGLVSRLRSQLRGAPAPAVQGAPAAGRADGSGQADAPGQANGPEQADAPGQPAAHPVGASDLPGAGVSGAPIRLEPASSYPLLAALGPGTVGLTLLWLLLASFPLWNGLWNRWLLGGDREAIRRARGKKWALLILPPLLAGVAWGQLGPEGASPFDTAPFKRGLTEGSLVPSEPPLLAPLPIGYAEIHDEESFRPPTYLRSSWLDADGRYLDPARRVRPDALTGYLPPPTPVEVRFGEAAVNSPLRHPLGTDELGRDLLVRLLWGGRVSLAVGILSALLLTVIGVVLGSLAGYFGGWLDLLVMRLIEVLQSIPAFFLILATMSFTDPADVPPMIAIVVIMALVRWTSAARLVRAEFLRLKDQEFVLAARSLGFSDLRTIFKHVLPNALSPVLVSAAFSVATGILTESAVSFLGFGVRHPEASWGSLINESKSADHWWVQVFPGLLIFLTVTCYNLVGDALRDALDPKTKR
jgi:peptide/nickel transport system permease protein